MKRIFLSYHPKDAVRVEEIRKLDRFRSYGFVIHDDKAGRPAFRDEDSTYLKSRMHLSIRQCAGTVCLLSDRAWKSPWVDWDVRTSVKEGKPVLLMALPGVTGDVKMPPGAEGQQWWLWNVERMERFIWGA